jgi:hypothetical protein
MSVLITEESSVLHGLSEFPTTPNIERVSLKFEAAPSLR